MSTIQLTITQQQVLERAANTIDGRLEWFPESVKGGARKKVLDGLFNRALITSNGGSHWYVAAEGSDALGYPRPDSSSATPQAPAQALPGPTTTKPRTRENSKQATVIKMLQRPEGATIHLICEATGWQADTVRGAFAGAFKKKLGLNIVSDKAQGSERVYRIA